MMFFKLLLSLGLLKDTYTMNKEEWEEKIVLTILDAGRDGDQ